MTHDTSTPVAAGAVTDAAPSQTADSHTDDAQTGDWRHYPQAELSPILSAALQHIALHGYHATSVRTIAKEVGVTVPALYYHYENKQAMLVALLDHSLAIVQDHVMRALADVPADPVSRLTAIVEAVALYAAHHRDLAILDSERRSLTEENLARYAAARDTIEGLLQECINDGCAAGLFATPAPRNCVRAILTMTQGIAGWFRPDGPRTPEQTAKEFARIALAAVEYRDL